MEKLKNLFNKLIKFIKWALVFSKKQCLNYIVNLPELNEDEFNILERAYFKHETLRRINNKKIDEIKKNDLDKVE